LVKHADADEILSRINNLGNDPYFIGLLDHEQSDLVSSVRDSCRGSSSLLHPWAAAESTNDHSRP